MSEVYAIVDDNTHKVINLVMWDGLSNWTPPENTHAVLASSNVAIDWTYDGSSFLAPPDDPEVIAKRQELGVI